MLGSSPIKNVQFCSSTIDTCLEHGRSSFAVDGLSTVEHFYFRFSTVKTYIAWVKHGRAFLFCSSQVKTRVVWVEHGRAVFVLFKYGWNISCLYFFTLKLSSKLSRLGRARLIFFSSCVVIYIAWAKHCWVVFGRIRSKQVFLGSSTVEHFFFLSSIVENYFAWIEHNRVNFFSFKHGRNIFCLVRALSSTFWFFRAQSMYALLGSRAVENFFLVRGQPKHIWLGLSIVEHFFFAYSSVKTCLALM